MQLPWSRIWSILIGITFLVLLSAVVGQAVLLQRAAAREQQHMAVLESYRAIVEKPRSAEVSQDGSDENSSRLVLGPLKTEIGGMSLDPAATQLAIADETQITIVDTKTRQVTGKLIEPRKPGRRHLAFSPDSRLLADSGGENGIRIWDVANREVRFLIKIDPHRPCTALAFSPDGRRLATGGLDGRIKLWSLMPFARLNEIESRISHGITALHFSDDGEVIAVGSSWGEVGFIKASDGSRIDRDGPDEGHRRNVTFLGFFDGGRRLATASTDHFVIVWDCSTGKLVRKLHEEFRGGCIDRVLAATILKGDILATASLDDVVRFWDMKGGRLIHKITLASKDKEDQVDRCTIQSNSNNLIISQSTFSNNIYIYNIKLMGKPFNP